MMTASYSTTRGWLVRSLPKLALSAFALTAAVAANAVVTINIVQDGANVFATASGTANTAGFTLFNGTTSYTTGLIGNFRRYDWLIVGPGPQGYYLGLSSDTIYNAFEYTNGPNGQGEVFAPDESTGAPVGVLGNELILPQGYVSGSALSATSVFRNTSLDTLHLKTGTYIATWGYNATADSLVVNVSTAPVPEPETFAMMFVGMGVIGLISNRKRLRR